MFVATNMFIKTFVATTKHLSRQQNFCRDNKTLVATRQNIFEKRMFCRNKHAFAKNVFVATKMILVAAPANDTEGYH